MSSSKLNKQSDYIYLWFSYYRKKDRKNSLTYKRHLEGIKKRVEARPLLLEQQASKHTVRLAKDNYAAALKKVGFSEDEVTTLVKEIRK